jgi:hypothetical protein
VDAAAAADLDFLLIGGHAVNAHGFIRTTTDFDFLLASRDLRALSEILEIAGYRPAFHLPGKWQIFNMPNHENDCVGRHDSDRDQHQRLGRGRQTG